MNLTNNMRILVLLTLLVASYFLNGALPAVEGARQALGPLAIAGIASTAYGIGKDIFGSNPAEEQAKQSRKMLKKASRAAEAQRDRARKNFAQLRPIRNAALREATSFRDPTNPFAADDLTQQIIPRIQEKQRAQGFNSTTPFGGATLTEKGASTPVDFGGRSTSPLTGHQDMGEVGGGFQLLPGVTIDDMRRSVGEGNAGMLPGLDFEDVQRGFRRGGGDPMDMLRTASRNNPASALM